MQSSLLIDWNELTQIPCETLQGDDAYKKAELLGLDIIDELQLTFRQANNSYALRDATNPTRAMARWGDICQYATKALEYKGWTQIRRHGQACIINTEKNLQVIFMSPNMAFGDESNIITSSYAKGIATELKLLTNKSDFSDSQRVRTFIVYYQPCTKIDFEDSSLLPFEIAYATGIYRIPSENDKTKCFPMNHTLRLMFTNASYTAEAYKQPLSDVSNEITEDDFGDLQAI